MGTALPKPVLPMFERESTMIEVRRSPPFAKLQRQGTLHLGLKTVIVVIDKAIREVYDQTKRP
jgi:hypothetical protein